MESVSLLGSLHRDSPKAKETSENTTFSWVSAGMVAIHILANTCQKCFWVI